MNMADRIQYLRKTKGISQEALADRLGVSRQAVSKWESEQSLPDLDKILAMSDYFDVTTDYLLKGIEPVPDADTAGRRMASKILYVASAALIAIGLFCAFGSWYEEQTPDCIWGSMVIQAVGGAGYFIGRLLSPARPPLAVKWLNLVLAAFMPISLLVALCLNRVAAPYPTDRIALCIFAAAYAVFAVLSFLLLRRRENTCPER